jgi:hypothetical protein
MPSPQLDLTAMAEKVTYIISREHKDYLTSAGPGKLRSDASACPRGLDFEEVAVSTGGSNFAEHLGEHFGWCSIT